MKVVKWWLGWLIEYLPILTVLVTVSVCYSGCVWLAVPGLAYESYKYEYNLNNDPNANGRDDSSSSQPASSNRASSDHSIE